MRRKYLTIPAVLLTLALCACELPNPIREVDVTPVSFETLTESQTAEERASDLPEKSYEVTQNTVEETPEYDEMNLVLLNLYEEQVGIELEKQAAKKKKNQSNNSNSNNSNNYNNNNDYYSDWDWYSYYDYNYDDYGYEDESNSGGGSQGGGYTYVEPEPYVPPSVDGYADQIVARVNSERANVGLGGLSTTPELMQAAQKRAEELATLYSHSRPDGSSCFTVLDDYGIAHFCAGENIAAGYTSPGSVMDGWMNSPGHKGNILGENYNHIGVGVLYVEGTQWGYYWVQLFTD